MAIVKRHREITLLVLSGFIATPEVAGGQDITLSTRTRCGGANLTPATAFMPAAR